MSEQENVDAQEIVIGVDPAVEGSDRAAFSVVEVRETHAEVRALSFTISPEAVNRINEVFASLKEALNLIPSLLANSETLERLSQASSDISAASWIPRLQPVRGFAELQQMMRDHMIQANQLPAHVLFDDTPGRQYPPEFVGERITESEARLRESMRRFNLYESGSQVFFPRYAVGELLQELRQEAKSKPIACQGCKHYDGNVYGGNQLICGMHPYGPEVDSCDDWKDDWLKTLKAPAWFSNLDFSNRELWLDRLKGLLIDSDPEFLGYRIMNGLQHAGVINHVELKAFIQEVRAGN